MTSRSLELLKSMVQHAAVDNTFAKIFSNVKFVSNEKDRVVCEMEVLEAYSNNLKTLHGGAIATLIDIVSSWIVTTEVGKCGVSVDLNVSFLRPVKIGENILIDARILRAGKSTAFLSVDILNKLDGSLIAQGRHTKNISKY